MSSPGGAVDLMTLIHTRTRDDQPLPCVACGRAVPDPGAGLLVACPPCTRRLRTALRRGSDVKPPGGRSRINPGPTNPDHSTAVGSHGHNGRGRLRAGQGAGDAL